jgi:hypothetical protein
MFDSMHSFSTEMMNLFDKKDWPRERERKRERERERERERKREREREIES